MKHPIAADLALYISGDAPVWQRLKTAVHLRSCEVCRERAQDFRLDREQLHASLDELPEGLDWNRLSAEMTANIHVGLAAGECVTPAATRESWGSAWAPAWNWRPAAVVMGVMVLFSGAWWLNMPAGDASAIARIFQGRTVAEDRGPVVQASSDGIEFRENGSALGVRSSNSKPVAVSVSFDGTASARYVDDDGQVTISTVYVQ